MSPTAPSPLSPSWHLAAAAVFLIGVAPYPAAPAISQWTRDSEEVRCPTFVEQNNCDCQASSDGLDFLCSEATFRDVAAVVSGARFAIKTLTLAPLSANVTCLCDKIFANGSVSELKIVGSNLEDIEEHAFDASPPVRLQTLILKDARLAQLPRAVGKVASLRRLDLEGNRIGEIFAYTFFGPSKLSYINLRGNRLDSLAENAFLGLENNLRELILGDNQFWSFPMSAVKILKKLQSLDLAGNVIQNVTSEPFTKLDALHFLDLSGNLFAAVNRDTFASMPNLNRLSLASNRIAGVDSGSFDSMHSLETLDLSRNALSRLHRDTFSRTSRLVKIDLSHNRLKTVAGVFNNLYALEEIRLNDNLLLAVTEDWFGNAPSLKTIHLERNVISGIVDDALQPLKRLSRLYLGQNFLTEVKVSYFRFNVALNSLSLDRNHISAIERGSFKGTPKLRELRLHDNIIREITRELFSSLSLLSELHLQNNKLTTIEPQAFGSLANLQHLDLTGNRLLKLEDIMMRYPSALRTLHLDENRLGSFHRETFSGQTTTEILSLANNKLEKLPAKVFEELINLFRLNLSRNRILEIEDLALVGLHQLRYLDLSFNRLAHLSNLTLRGLQQAEQVDLSNNRIASIDSEAFTGFHHLKRLDLSRNKLRVLRDGAFRGCLTLNTLLLNYAGVRTIEPTALSDFKSLEHLDIRNNEIAIPDSIHKLRILTNLRSLLLSGNNLSNLTDSWSLVSNNGSLASLDSMEELRELELENCGMDNFNVVFIAANAKLKKIKLGGNKFKALPPGLFKNQVFLKELHLDRNNFSTMPAESLQYLYNLVSLNISGNCLGHLGENFFDNVGGLRHLDVSLNDMETIAERAFHNVTKLQTLELGRNRLDNFPTRTFVPLMDLRTFSAAHNRLPYIPVAVQGLRKVERLDLAGNLFDRLKEKPMSRAVMLSVDEVRITRTNLSTISPNDFDLFPYLRRLYLGGNRLSRVAPYAFRSLGKLEVLDMGRNDIIHLSRERLFGLFSLRTLNLSRNHLGSLDAFPEDLMELAVLDVSHNRLRSVSRDSLKALAGLARLDLRGNQLATLFPEVLRPLASLRELDFSGNHFESLPLLELEHVEGTLESVKFEENPLVCSCSSYTQKIWMRQHRKWLDTERRGPKVGPQCAEPRSLDDRHLLAVKDSELCPLPSVSSLAFASRDPYNFLITWQSPDTNMTGLRGFIVAYHRLDKNDQVKKYRVAPSVRGFRIEGVSDSAVYLVCVVTRGSSYGSGGGEDDVEDNDDGLQGSPYLGMLDSLDGFAGNDDFAEGEEGDEEEEEDLDGQFYVMPLEWTREKREAADFDIGTFAQDFFGFGEEDSGFAPGNGTAADGSDADPYLAYPSSNDTELLVNKPAVVNLGSRSSKCIRINTPPDPANLRLIDDKRMSVIIGVSMGLGVFFFIIVGIVFIKPLNPKEDGVIADGEGSTSVEADTKSPKSNGSSKNNSISAHGLAGHLAGVTAGMAMGTARRTSSTMNALMETPAEARKKPKPRGVSGGRGGTADREQPIKQNTLPHHREKRNSSTESNRSQQQQQQQQHHNQTLPRHHRDREHHQQHQQQQHLRQRDSGGGGSELDFNNGSADPLLQQQRGQLSWQGSPRQTSHRRRSNLYEGLSGQHHSSYSTTLPRRNTEMSMMPPPNVATSRMLPHHGHGGSGMSLDTGTTLSKRRGVVVEGGRPDDSRNCLEPSTSIPLIEFHAPSAEGPPLPPLPPLRALGPPAYNRPPPPPQPPPPNQYPSTPGGGRFGIRQPPPKLRSSPQTMRGSTFAADNHVRAVQSNHVKNRRPPEDPNGIEYLPEALPPAGVELGGGGGGVAGGRPPYIKYNSFAHY